MQLRGKAEFAVQTCGTKMGNRHRWLQETPRGLRGLQELASQHIALCDEAGCEIAGGEDKGVVRCVAQLENRFGMLCLEQSEICPCRSRPRPEHLQVFWRGTRRSRSSAKRFSQ